MIYGLSFSVEKQSDIMLPKGRDFIGRQEVWVGEGLATVGEGRMK